MNFRGGRECVRPCRRARDFPRIPQPEKSTVGPPARKTASVVSRARTSSGLQSGARGAGGCGLPQEPGFNLRERFPLTGALGRVRVAPTRVGRVRREGRSRKQASSSGLRGQPTSRFAWARASTSSARGGEALRRRRTRPSVSRSSAHASRTHRGRYGSDWTNMQVTWTRVDRFENPSRRTRRRFRRNSGASVAFLNDWLRRSSAMPRRISSTSDGVRASRSHRFSRPSSACLKSS